MLPVTDHRAERSSVLGLNSEHHQEAPCVRVPWLTLCLTTNAAWMPQSKPLKRTQSEGRLTFLPELDFFSVINNRQWVSQPIRKWDEFDFQTGQQIESRKLSARVSWSPSEARPVALWWARILPSSAFSDGQVIWTPPCVPHLRKRLLTLRWDMPYEH